MKIAIRLSQKINSRIHNSRIAIRRRIAQLGLHDAMSRHSITRDADPWLSGRWQVPEAVLTFIN